MCKEFFPKPLMLLALGILTVPLALALYFSTTTASAQTGEAAPGSLTIVDAEGTPRSACPLKHTDVKASISGFISRVTVTQQFENPFNERIEAVYTFPLPQNAAVDDMTMLIGERTIKGRILPREEAQALYDAAKQSGKMTSLLAQERPNIFTQSVANILPGDQIKITISYVETLRYDSGAYEFVFPMVVGQRYIPGTPHQGSQGGRVPGTTQVPDASRITPPSSTTRSGHDVSIEVALDAGLIVNDITSKSHQISVRRPDLRSARVKLREGATIPNKDFILRYGVASTSIQDAVLAHRSEKGGFFSLIIQPPQRVTADDVTPKELVFVLDTSGSMKGFPIAKAKETMRMALEGLYPSDTFNLITFSGDTHVLFPQPVPATEENLGKAHEFLRSRTGDGGTEMMTAIKAALEPSDSQSHVRIVCFMTDGLVGNDMAIIDEVRRHQNARVFSFGIGNAVNRFLLDKMAEAGRGEVEYVTLQDDGSAAAKRFHERIRNPLLTDVSIDWNGLPVADVYPKRIPDLFGAKPVIVTGRFHSAGRATIKLKGKMAGSDFVREILVELPQTMALHEVLAPLWARARIDDLMSQDYMGAQLGRMQAELTNPITQLGIEFRLITQFTSFVAIEEMMVADGGRLRRIDVPVEVPAGVNRHQITFSGGVSSVGGQFFTASQAQAAAGRGLPNAYLIGKSGPGRQATAEETRNADLRKLHASLLAVVERLRKKNIIPSPAEARFVRADDKAELQIWLTERSELTMAQLKALGLEVIFDAQNSKLVIGRLSIDKLEALAMLKFVKYVSPQLSRY